MRLTRNFTADASDTTIDARHGDDTVAMGHIPGGKQQDLFRLNQPRSRFLCGGGNRVFYAERQSDRDTAVRLYPTVDGSLVVSRETIDRKTFTSYVARRWYRFPAEFPAATAH